MCDSSVIPFSKSWCTGITTCLKNGGRVEAQQLVRHESVRMTVLYDRRDDEVSLRRGRADRLRHKITQPGFRLVSLHWTVTSTTVESIWRACPRLPPHEL